jgi:N-dimethylarginine dimethylaminohydrolase
MWLDASTVLIGCGQRTNTEGAMQVADALQAMGVQALVVDLPYGTMHLMGILRIVDHDLALAWPRRLAVAAVQALMDRGYGVAFLPDDTDWRDGAALNLVTLGPRRVLMPAGYPGLRAFYEAHGVVCAETAVGELSKAAGAVGCLTGVLRRDFA